VDISLVDDVIYWKNTSVTVIWRELAPNRKYRVFVLAASEANIDFEGPIWQTVTIQGNGNDNPAPFVQDGRGKSTGSGDFKQLHLLVNGAVGSSSTQLETLGLIVTSTADGKITVQVDPVAGGHVALSALAIQELMEETNPGDSNPWRNTANRFDVSGDGRVAPLDVLRIINELNLPQFRDAQGALPVERPTDASYYDVNGDGLVTSNDALQLINFLNTEPAPEGELSLGLLEWLLEREREQGAAAPISSTES
jgi:hypothetical protein